MYGEQGEQGTASWLLPGMRLSPGLYALGGGCRERAEPPGPAPAVRVCSLLLLSASAGAIEGEQRVLLSALFLKQTPPAAAAGCPGGGVSSPHRGGLEPESPAWLQPVSWFLPVCLRHFPRHRQASPTVPARQGAGPLAVAHRAPLGVLRAALAWELRGAVLFTSQRACEGVTPRPWSVLEGHARDGRPGLPRAEGQRALGRGAVPSPACGTTALLSSCAHQWSCRGAGRFTARGPWPWAAGRRAGQCRLRAWPQGAVGTGGLPEQHVAERDVKCLWAALSSDAGRTRLPSLPCQSGSLSTGHTGLQGAG